MPNKSKPILISGYASEHEQKVRKLLRALPAKSRSALILLCLEMVADLVDTREDYLRLVGKVAKS